MSQDRMREEFEAVYGERWANGWPLHVLFSRGTRRDYLTDSTQNAWEIWQASRAALVVELPASRNVTGAYLTDACYDPDDLRAAIEAAGVLVAP
jgi:hypothetical protein